MSFSDTETALVPKEQLSPIDALITIECILLESPYDNSNLKLFKSLNKLYMLLNKFNGYPMFINCIFDKFHDIKDKLLILSCCCSLQLDCFHLCCFIIQWFYNHVHDHDHDHEGCSIDLDCCIELLNWIWNSCWNLNDDLDLDLDIVMHTIHIISLYIIKIDQEQMINWLKLINPDKLSDLKFDFYLKLIIQLMSDLNNVNYDLLQIYNHLNDNITTTTTTLVKKINVSSNVNESPKSYKFYLQQQQQDQIPEWFEIFNDNTRKCSDDYTLLSSSTTTTEPNTNDNLKFKTKLNYMIHRFKKSSNTTTPQICLSSSPPPIKTIIKYKWLDWFWSFWYPVDDT
ncbi:hypothetical protein CANARDRAFT_10152 [[Candida] arabinofermentans NRRL YB-2248]|uniref:Uncharacterized protein n=1 Tax=[Candida] arabinofermentans NRRL YB-2248 TaxID=983967 RepID=A0A1E4STW5_9ASCO|nr:hypothetical protein CANARDRAFT_10152 [[Candida] arabinofermentans NRRL YB-2248]